MKASLLVRRRPVPGQERVWARGQRASRRWAIRGAVVGVVCALVAFAPATWLARVVNDASGERLLLADARGSVWSGSAVAVLQGGPGSRDSAALPGRLQWRLMPAWGGMALHLRQACCLQGELSLALQPGWQGWQLPSLQLQVPARPAGLGQWPARWLAGLGTPWNTLQLGGMLHLATPGLALTLASGHTQFSGALDVQLLNASSRISAIDPLGSYRLALRSGLTPPGAAASAAPTTLALDTLDGALRLSGSGQWGATGLRFRGEARAAEGQEAGLTNLLNIIGRRQGALSVISIG